VRRFLAHIVSGLLSCATTFGSVDRVAADEGTQTANDEPEEQPVTASDAPPAKSIPETRALVGEPQSVAVDLKRLGAELDLHAAEARRKRLTAALIGLGAGSTLMPTGVILLGRTDGVPRALVIGMIVGGSAQLLSVPLALFPTRMEEIHDEFMSRPASVESKGTIRAVENEWREAAKNSRDKRQLVGTTLAVVGAVNVTAGVVFLLGPDGILGMSRRTQYTWGGVTMGTGVSVATVSVRYLVEWSLEETSWEAYRAMKADAGRLGKPILRPPKVGFTPLPGGGLVVTTLTF
jgi:hypothetical protein